LNPVMQKTLVLDHLWENEVNRSSNYFLSVAGKGANTARVLTELGAQTIHLTHGGGLFAPTFARMLVEDGVDARIVESGSEIRFCHTLINREHHTVTEIVEEAAPVGPTTDGIMRERYLELHPSCDIVTISGTKAAGYGDDIIPWMVGHATRLGKQVVLDVRGDDLLKSLPHPPTVIKPNMKEFAETLFPDELFREHKTEESVLATVTARMISLEKEFGVTTVITQGAKSVYHCEGGRIIERKVDPVVPVNTIGCGDAFTAGLTYGMSEERTLDESISIGIDCGRKNALNLKPGTIRGAGH